MPSGIQMWSQTAASNGAADSAINYAEGMAPSALNDSGRALMAVVAKYRDDVAGTLTTGGTTTAYTLTTNTGFTTLALLNGMKLGVKFNATNGASPTLNVDGLGAKALQLYSGTVIPTGMIIANTIWEVTYDNSIPAFIVTGVPGVLPATTFTGAITATSATFSGVIGASDGTKTAPGYSWSSDPDTGLYRIGANNIGVSCADTKILDISTTGVSVTGGITASNGLTVSAGSVALPAGSVANAALASPNALVLIKTQVASGAATVEFINGTDGVVLDNTYDRYVVTLDNITTSSDGVALQMQIGTGGGPTYQTSGYSYNNLVYSINLGSTVTGSASAGAMQLTYDVNASFGIGNASNENFLGRVEFANPEATSGFFHIMHGGGYDAAGNDFVHVSGSAKFNTAGTAITAVRFKASSGNLSGRFTLYAMTKA